MKRFILPGVVLLFANLSVFGQYVITSATGPGSSVSEDFDDPASPIAFDAFRGRGFSSTPETGEIDSDYWIAGGAGLFNLECECFEEPVNMQYGDERTSFAAAAYIGGESPGNTEDGFGVYAFDTGGGAKNIGLGMESLFDLFNPGFFETRVLNDTGNTITDISIAYDILVFNNTDQTNAFDFSWGTSSNGLSGGVMTSLESLDFASPGNADASPAWSSTPRSVTLNNISVPDGQYIHLRWTTRALDVDISDTSEFDEFALDNLSVQIAPALPTTITVTGISSASGVNTFRWMTTPAGRGVDVYRSTDLENWALLSAENRDSAVVDSTPVFPRSFYTAVPAGAEFP